MNRWMQNQMPLIAMIFTQFVYTAMFLLSKAAISSGMKPSIFITYRQAVATLTLAPFAYFCERNKSNCRLTSKLLCKIFIVAFIGVTMTLNLHYVALNYISATFATAINNTIPVMVFILALCLRMENLSITERHGMAKVLGTVMSLSGAMVFTFYKGPAIYSASINQPHNSIATTYTRTHWIKGAALLLTSCFSWSLWLIMQGPILKEYPAKLRVTALQCGFSCAVTMIYGAAVERNISSWKLAWNVNLFSVAYCGIIVTGITYTLQIWVVGKKGALFTSIFTPLPLMLTAFFSAFLFHESLYCGSVVGSVLLIAGLYSFLWGKKKEAQKNVIHQMRWPIWNPLMLHPTPPGPILLTSYIN